MTEANHQEMMAARAEMARPGEGHERPEPLVGEWDTVTTLWMEPGAEPLQTEGSVTKEWVLGGRFVQERLQV